MTLSKHNHLAMSASKKAHSASDSSKNSTSSKPDAVVPSPVAVKRPAEEELSAEDDGPEDWEPVLRLVFVTRNSGVLREINGKKNFTIVGNFADDKVVALQVWGKHADRVSNFFSK